MLVLRTTSNPKKHPQFILSIDSSFFTLATIKADVDNYIHGFPNIISQFPTDQFFEEAQSHLALREREYLDNSSNFMNKMKGDSAYKQVLPYIIARQQQPDGTYLYFPYRRLKASGESRLADNGSLGYGGHVDLVDVVYDKKSIIDFKTTTQLAALREANEEFSIIDPNGLEIAIDEFDLIQFSDLFILDHTNEVGQLHLGMILHLEIPFGFTVKTKEADQLAQLPPMTLVEMLASDIPWENWTKYYLEYVQTSYPGEPRPELIGTEHMLTNQIVNNTTINVGDTSVEVDEPTVREALEPQPPEGEVVTAPAASVAIGKPKAISQWFKNGDHPHDYDKDVEGLENGELKVFSGKHAEEQGWEGQVVRYYRDPYVNGQSKCPHCGDIMHNHGWIDQTGYSPTVCPGDWIVTDDSGRHFPVIPQVAPAIFALLSAGEKLEEAGSDATATVADVDIPLNMFAPSGIAALQPEEAKSILWFEFQELDPQQLKAFPAAVIANLHDDAYQAYAQRCDQMGVTAIPQTTTGERQMLHVDLGAVAAEVDSIQGDLADRQLVPPSENANVAAAVVEGVDVSQGIPWGQVSPENVKAAIELASTLKPQTNKSE